MNEVIFQTRDINLASYLKIKGYIMKTAKKEGNRILFGFVDKRDRSEREKDIEDFYNNSGGFLSYTDARRNLKSFLHHI